MKIIGLTIMSILVASCGGDNNYNPGAQSRVIIPTGPGNSLQTREIEKKSQAARKLTIASRDLDGKALCKQTAPVVLSFNESSYSYKLYRYSDDKKLVASHSYPCIAEGGRVVKQMNHVSFFVDRETRSYLKAESRNAPRCKTKLIKDHRTNKVIGYEFFQSFSKLKWDKRRRRISVEVEEKRGSVVNGIPSRLKTVKRSYKHVNCERF